MLVCVPFALAWAGSDLGHHLPRYESHTIAWAVGGDVVLVTGLFVLGGNFWGDVRALFEHDARVELSVRGHAPGDESAR